MLVLFYITMVIAKLELHLTCTCSDINYINDCESMQLCQWDNNKCKTISCSSINDSQLCASLKECAYLNDKCTQFTKCTNYIGLTTGQCQEQSHNCTYRDGTTCQDLHISTCSELAPTQNTCIRGSDGPCQLINDTCILLTSCAQIHDNTLTCIQNGQSCALSNDNLCIDKTCANYKKQSQCTKLYSFDNKELSVCGWQDDKCIELDESALVANTCQLYTKDTYTWDSNNNLCRQCILNGQLIASILIIYALII